MKKENSDMSINAMEDVFIIKNGKIATKLKNSYSDRVEVAKSLFGILPKNVDMQVTKEERLRAK